MPVIQKPKPRGPETYPQSKDEAQKLRISIIKAMGDPNVQNQIVKALGTDPRTAVPMIVRSAANVIATAIRAIKKKYSGKTDMKAVEMCIKLAIRQIELISKGVGKGPIPPQMQMLLAKGISVTLDKLLKDPQQQPPQPGQPQPGQQPGQPQPPQQPQMAPSPAQPGQMPPEEGLLGG